MALDLAPVYLDDARVTLEGNPRPQVAAILLAGGRSALPEGQVVRVGEAGTAGQPLRLDEVIDREKAITPVYLRIVQSESARPGGPTLTPGDFSRGTQEAPPSGDQATGKADRFAVDQSFADPAHREGSPRVASHSTASQGPADGAIVEGGVRTQETSREEGIRQGAGEGDLDRASEEE